MGITIGIRAMIAVLIGLFLFVGIHTASADLLFDRGLPTANLNNATYPVRSNLSLFGIYPISNPTSYQVYGDDFTIGASGTFHLDTIRVWMVSGSWSPVVKLWVGQEGGPLEMVSSTFTATKMTYANGEDFYRIGFPEIHARFDEIDFTVNLDVVGGQKYQFFMDTVPPLIPRSSPDGHGGWVFEGYASSYLHLSNHELSGTPQEGWDNYVLLLTLNDGIPGSIDKVDTKNMVFKDKVYPYSVDANIQIFGSHVAPLPSTLWLIGSGLLGLAGLGRLRKS